MNFMKTRSPHQVPAVIFGLLGIITPFSCSLAATASDYTAKPPFVTRSAIPNVLFNLSTEARMYSAAYHDQYSDEDSNGTIEAGECGGRDGAMGVCYYPGNEYLGIFDQNKEYTYNSSAGYFVPTGYLNPDHSTQNGGWSGNFLNWATMTVIDEVRRVLTGGRRTHDTETLTVLQRANLPSGYDAALHQPKRIETGVNVAPATVSPFTAPAIYLYSHGYQLDIGTSLQGDELAANLNVSAQVCDSTIGIENNCVAYTTGGDTVYYKPEGLIQQNSERLRFAVMSYASDASESRHGGVLRATMKYVGPKLPDGSDNPRREYGIDGIFIDDPDDSVLTGGNKTLGNSGVINFVNKFDAAGYSSSDPLAELYYESLNYYKHRGRTPEFADGLPAPAGDAFPIITEWDDPIESWCQANFIIAFSDAGPRLDKHLPGTYFTAPTFNGHILAGEDYGEPGNSDPAVSVTALTNTVGELEGLNGTVQYIGCTASACDMSNTRKTVPGLGEVFGALSTPTDESSYYLAGLAYYAHTYDIRDDLPGKQTVTAFMVDTQQYRATPSDKRMNVLRLAGKYGGFNELDYPAPEAILDNSASELQPNLTAEWDADSDGNPDNYLSMTNPGRLTTGLAHVISDIAGRASSGTGPSVISGSRSGEGAIYQSVFYPRYQDRAHHAISWAGAVHVAFVDGRGRLREDTNRNGILEEDDDIVIFTRDPHTNDPTVEKYRIVGPTAEVTTITFPSAAGLSGKYFRLNSVSNTFYVWYTVAGAGDDPQPASDMSGIEVALAADDSVEAVADKTATAIQALSHTFSVDYSANSDTITITNVTPGETEDADAGDAAVMVTVTTQGAGESTSLAFTGAAEEINYLWNSSDWLNGISDADITMQRSPYSDISRQRYIFTFIDSDQDGVNDRVDNNGDGIFEVSEVRDFAIPDLPSTAQLVDASTIYPYIPVSSNSKILPAAVGSADIAEYLQYQTQRVINYIRGQDQDEQAIGDIVLPPFRSRRLDLDDNGSLETTWRLGDIVYSSPTVVSRPQEALHLLYHDSSYGSFAAHYQHRRTVIYTGANDGMLHAFNGGFYEDRFDVYPATPDGQRDAQYLVQPKDGDGAVDTTISAYPLGQELWAYVPYNLLPHLYWLTEANYDHVYYVDLKPRVFDARIFPDDIDHPGGWGTVLVSGMRFGGGKISVDMNRLDGDVDSEDRTMTSAYCILDITNPEKPPTLLGEITFPHLGYTTCYPTVAAVKSKNPDDTTNNWYLVFGSGPAETDGSPGTVTGVSLTRAISAQPAKLYVVDLVALVQEQTLKTLDQSGNMVAASPATNGYFQDFTGDNNAFISAPVAVDYDLDYQADVVYFGTVSYNPVGDGYSSPWGGKLRRLVMQQKGDPVVDSLLIDPTATTEWNGDSVLFDLETRYHQPISAAPTVGLDPYGFAWVYFGTGRYFTREDGFNVDPQSFYGVREPMAQISSDAPAVFANSYAEQEYTNLNDATYVEVSGADRTVHGCSWCSAEPKSWRDFTTETLSDYPGGWRYDFPNIGERSIGEAPLYGETLTFTTYSPPSDMCAYDGDGWLYGLYYLTGTAAPQPVFPSAASTTYVIKQVSTGSGSPASPTIHVDFPSGQDGDTTAYLQTSDGFLLPVKQDNCGATRSWKKGWSYQE